MKKIGIATVILIGLSKILFPGNTTIKFEHFSIEEGLSQNIVSCIFQDRIGFMWIGTDDGLNKFDGYTFKTYHHRPNEPYSLSHNRINSIYEDRRGILWIGTRGGGLNKFIREEEKFFHYIADPNDHYTISDNTVLSIYEDSSGMLWIGTYRGLNKFDREKERFTHYLPDNTGSNESRLNFHNWVTSIVEDSHGQLWIGTHNGLNRFDPGKGKFTRYQITPNGPDHFNNNKVQSICKDKSGILWIGTFGGVKIFDPQKGKFIPVENKPSHPKNICRERVQTVFKDHCGSLWLGTINGVYQFNPETDHVEHFQYRPDNTRSLSHNIVMSIYEDRSNVMWIGTFGGLNKFDYKKKKFAHYKLPGINSSGNNPVFSIYEDRSGALWVGTYKKGLTRFDRKSGINTNYRSDPNDMNSLSDNSVFSILESKAGEFWIGTENGLNKFDYPTKKFHRYLPDPANPNSLSNGRIWPLLADRVGILWIGTYNGLNQLDKDSETFMVYKNEPGNSNSLSYNIISAIYEDQSGVLWIGTYGGGVNQLDREKKQFTRYQHNPDDPNSLSNNKVYTIHEDQSGKLWIGTNSGGLNQLDKKTGTFINYTRGDGLPNNVIFGILEDKQGNLWLSTNQGLSKFNPKTGTFRNYISEDGLQGYEFFPGAYYKSKSGEMFFGGSNGFNAFYPQNVKDNPHIPPVVITAFLKFNEEVKLPKPISEINQLKLSYKDSFFSFKFTALDYTASERNKYAYKLEGFEDDWIPLNDKHDIMFTRLPPGEYVFRVKGSNSDGIWNEQGASIAITISPAVWQTWWFKLFIAALFFGILALLQRLLTNSLKQKLDKERLAKELKLKADLTAMLVHDLRSPLTVVMGYSEMLTEMPEKMNIPKIGKVITSSSEKMLTLINDMLDISKFEAGKMTLNKKNVTLFEIVTNIIEITTPLLEKKGINLIWEYETGIKEEALLIDPEKIGQVINNLLSNAIKFTSKKGNIIIKHSRIAQDGNLREISVTDDGPGVPPETQKHLFDKYAQLNINVNAKGTGLGLAVSKMIIESHGGTIGYRPGPPGYGSTFYFRLPVPGLENQ